MAIIVLVVIPKMKFFNFMQKIFGLILRWMNSI
jgi:hypothetical protein